jgi:hypothetical protein
MKMRAFGVMVMALRQLGASTGPYTPCRSVDTSVWVPAAAAANAGSGHCHGNNKVTGNNKKPGRSRVLRLVL